MENESTLGIIEEGSVQSLSKIVSDASYCEENKNELPIENNINISIKEELPSDSTNEIENQQDEDILIPKNENPLDAFSIKEEYHESSDEVDNSTPIKNIPFCVSSNEKPAVEEELPIEFNKIKEEIVNIPESNDEEMCLAEVEVKNELHVENFNNEPAIIKSEISTDIQELYNYDDNFVDKDKSQNEVPNNSDRVVPVALKTNSEFARCNSKSDNDDNVEIIVPLENPLQIPICLNENIDESSELLKELHKQGEEIDTLLAPRGFVCLICDRTFRYLGPFQKHQRGHDQQINPLNESLTPEPVVSLEVLTDNITKENGIYSCGCGKQFRRKTSVSACMKVHRNSGVGCPWCPLVFLKQIDLRSHCRLDHPSHRKTKHHCITCNKVFLTRKSLRTHCQKHHAKKPPSDINNPDQTDAESKLKTESKIVPRKSVRNLPKNSELNETLKFKFVCRTCSEEFTTLGALTLHSSKHKKQKFICDRCNEKFSSKNELSSHKNLHCRGGDFLVPDTKASTCDICEKVFQTEELMLKHKSTHPFVIFTKDDSTHTQIFFK